MEDDVKKIEVYFHYEQELYKRLFSDVKKTFGDNPSDSQIAGVIVCRLREYYNM